MGRWESSRFASVVQESSGIGRLDDSDAGEDHDPARLREDEESGGADRYAVGNASAVLVQPHRRRPAEQEAGHRQRPEGQDRKRQRAAKQGGPHQEGQCLFKAEPGHDGGEQPGPNTTL